MDTKTEVRLQKLKQLKNKLASCTDNQKALAIQQEIIVILKDTLSDKEIIRELALKNIRQPLGE